MKNDDGSWFSLLKGDKKAFEKIFNSYYEPLCQYAVTLLKSPEIAEEVVQDTFIKIWQNQQNLKIHSSVRAYLYRSIHNNCISYYRCQNTKNKNEQKYSEIAVHADLVLYELSENILESIINGELAECLNQTINALPSRCKEIFYLSRYEQQSNKEISAKLGISINTVKKQLFRALSKLKEAYINFQNT